mmetsp:Transcript_12649/g.25390  ORF Transcript_12649/g.25390 Transcript_12649/m.25390 type:complete len:201 (+) Transcript_12649:2-604(+)
MDKEEEEEQEEEELCLLLKTDIAKVGFQRKHGIAVGADQERDIRGRLNRVLLVHSNDDDDAASTSRAALEKTVERLLGQQAPGSDPVKLAGMAMEKLQLVRRRPTDTVAHYRKLLVDAAGCTEHENLKGLLLRVARDDAARVTDETLARADALVELVDEVEEALDAFFEQAYGDRRRGHLGGVALEFGGRGLEKEKKFLN